MKIKQILFLIFIFLTLSRGTIVYAEDSSVQRRSIDDTITGADNFILEGKNNASVTIDETNLVNISNTVYNTLLAVGVATAVVMASILGIQFMMGAAEEKANVKEKMIPFIIGCMVVFGAFGIWKIMIIFLNNF